VSAFRYQTQIQTAQGQALDGVRLYVCTQPANTESIPPSPLATLYTDSTNITQAANPAISDGNGNLHFYAAAGTYTLVFYDPQQRIPTFVFPDIIVVSPGSGTVTSVALTMPAEFSVSGSPIVGGGTLAVSAVNENALTVYAGPVSGPAAAPTFKTLASLLAALGVGSGTVTSIANALSLNALLTGSVSGSPVTSSGTITITLGFANQNANLFLAGPASGGAGAVTARRIAPADLPAGLVSVAFSATPVFDAFAGLTFEMTLTGNVTSSSVANGTAGNTITFIIRQDGTGGRTFAWPANFKGASLIAPDANLYSVQSFVFDGSAWHANGPGNTHS